MIHSRAFLLLQKDLANIDRLPLQGITASSVSEDNFYKWTATIHGLGNTIWEGGIFHLSLKFSEHYNTVPPSIHFMTIPYHPNVNPSTGNISSSLLTEWNEEYSLASLLLTIQTLLNEPELETGCIMNHQASHHYLYAPHTYRQLVYDCVTASLRIQAGQAPYDQSDSKTHKVTTLPVAVQQASQKPQKILKKIPYDDYHVLWQGLATSIPVYNPNNEFMQLLAKDKHLNHVHFESDQSKTTDLQRRTEDHLTLKYGVSKKCKNSKSMTLKEKQKRVADLTALYSNKIKSPLPPPSTTATDDDQPVNDLLAWTKSLDENELDNVL